jgi:hypothetical protein
MRPPLKIRLLPWALAAAAAMSLPAAHAKEGFVPLSERGKKVLVGCNPSNQASVTRCKVADLPGEPGYTLVASNSTPVVKNDVQVGTLHDSVWANEAGDHIFGMQVELNAEPYDLSGLSFNLNDLFRRVLEDEPAAVAYQMGASTKALKKSGRTFQGLKEPDRIGSQGLFYRNQPIRNNDWVDFRIDANAAEPTGASSANSPWLLVKTRAPAGFSLQPFAIRALSSDFSDASQIVEIYLPGYQPN